MNVYNLDAFLQEVYLYYYGKDIFYCSQAGVEPCVGVPSAVWLIRASTLIKSQLPDIVVDRCVFRCILFSLNTQRPFPSSPQFLGLYASFLPAVLCFLRLANRFVCLEHNAPHGHVYLLQIPNMHLSPIPCCLCPNAFFQEDI